MVIHFSKYQGTGNDFIIIDDRIQLFPFNDSDLVKFLCDRRFGIGGDGLMLLQESSQYDFKMVYYNADGRESTMCGNGGRCLSAFARQTGMFDDKASFEAVDGVHEAIIEPDGDVRLKMNDITHIENDDGNLYLNTGSPHYTVLVNALDDFDVVKEGRNIRYNDKFSAEGTNVNFIQQMNQNILFVRTYERGVEDETLSCGTGVIASAITAAYLDLTDKSTANIQTKGGNLQVSFKKLSPNEYTDVWLKGPANFVFKGEIEV
jgi:diaminopimelate epimerase